MYQMPLPPMLQRGVSPPLGWDWQNWFLRQNSSDYFALNVEKLCNREKKGRIGVDLFKLNASYTNSSQLNANFQNKDFNDPLFVILIFASDRGFFLFLSLLPQLSRETAASNALKFAFETAPFFIGLS